MYRIHESHSLLAVFIAFATLNSMYSSFWDLFMDWSLLQPSYSASSSGAGGSQKSGKSWPGLRPILSCSSPYYYYCAMVIDVLLRFNWIFYVIFAHDLQHSTIASFLISFSEANRRGMWTLFRVENEHAANVMRFKATRDLADLPLYKAEKLYGALLCNGSEYFAKGHRLDNVEFTEHRCKVIDVGNNPAYILLKNGFQIFRQESETMWDVSTIDTACRHREEMAEWPKDKLDAIFVSTYDLRT